MARVVSFDGKVVVVTGGARGIGYATAAALQRLGAKVAIGDIDEAAVKQAGTELGLDVYAKLDVSDRDSFEAFLDQVERQLGPIDVLVNNAGICPTGRFVDEPDEVTQRTLAINTYGVMLGTKLAAARMVKRRKGHVINIASLGAVSPMPGIATYCASKCAVLGFTDVVRLELQGTGVDVSAVLPTLVNTRMIDGVSGRGVGKADPDDIAAGIVRLIRKPKPRMAVTRGAGLITTVTSRFIPLRVFESMRHRLGFDQIFDEGVDREKRRDYEERARHT
ncbi:SDR family oxidoreductase [Mycobacterium hubeiense]|uniref:SDR family oxidoreductase n=1 Tax=Mycobacterium hubeiense TaxID=1867256 RepID=UPI000C7F488C|nr:SDR family oxidoreductase [Mycobacterium sp. QGD 101]